MLAAVFVLGFGGLGKAFSPEDLSRITGLPEKNIAVKNLSHKAKRDPETLWAIDVTGIERRTLYPFTIVVTKKGSLLDDEKRREFSKILGDRAPTAAIAQIKELDFPNGYGISGIPAFGPDAVIYTSLMSLESHGVDVKVAVRLGADSTPLLEKNWNEGYTAKMLGESGISEFLEKVCRGLESLNPDELITFEDALSPVLLRKENVSSDGITRNTGNVADTEPESSKTSGAADRRDGSQTHMNLFLVLFIFGIIIVGYLVLKRFRRKE